MNGTLSLVKQPSTLAHPQFLLLSALIDTEGRASEPLGCGRIGWFGEPHRVQETKLGKGQGLLPEIA